MMLIVPFLSCHPRLRSGIFSAKIIMALVGKVFGVITQFKSVKFLKKTKNGKDPASSAG